MTEAAGWAAIDTTLQRIYGDAEPMHWGTLHKWALGGPDPLDGISAYPRTEPVPHWHFIGYGMSELYEKESDNADESGWGFEFTFRLARRPSETEPPVWAANFLQNLARYVFQSGNWFEAGHTMKANGPIAAERPDSAIQAITFVLDPELGEISTVHGKLQFLQVVGLTLDEYEAARGWGSAQLVETLGPRMPLCVTDLDRDSLLSDPDIAAAVRAGTERDGPAGNMLLVAVADWTLDDCPGGAATLRFGALPAPNIGRELAARLPRGGTLVVHSDNSAVRFVPGERFAVEPVDDEILEVSVPAAAADDLIGALRSQAGRYPVPSMPGLVIEIEPSVMRDGRGNETGEVVG
ncbi:suppressor of fused domain protein [Actinomadura sp. HBU206391]|uniref:suppressor of fused domain protein n=1 Tax=Actinomadura sp. HBU206391 TaxID=2731692 RepID=UPI001C9C2274|nr:suppressor of fused domain protein [Actinomadura sp. HBU206391]